MQIFRVTYPDVSCHDYSGGYVDMHAECHVEIIVANQAKDANDGNDASAL